MSPTQEQARHKIRQLVNKYRAMSDADRRLISESAVVHQFLDPFFEALGWPVHDPARYKYELSTLAGRPDMILTPEQGGAIFVEAKRFGKIEELAQARKTIAGIVTPGQLALPGMATDRTAEEQQAINYAFQNNGEWAILTNFEKLRLFNARRDWLVLSFEQPGAFLDEFDLLWQLSYDNILAGELERLSNQRHREDVDTNYLKFINEWRQRLAQDILARPTQNWWAFGDEGRLNLAALRAVVQRLLDRLVVIRFAEDHLVIPPGALYDFYDLRRRNPYTFSLTQFIQQLFRRFDEDHNSALFAPDLADGASLSDATLSDLIQKLYEARYRAMPPDIMGNTYEQYLGKTLNLDAHGGVITADNLETRKKQGSYYTPQVIVRYLVDQSLGRYLYGTPDGRPPGLRGGEVGHASNVTYGGGEGPVLPAGGSEVGHASSVTYGGGGEAKTAADIRSLRLLDPSCGSGSFLIYAYEVLADFYRREIKRLEEERTQRLQELIGQGVTTPFDLELQLTPYRAELERLQDYPRLIVETHLYGVDLDPQAAEIATVNLMMRAMADQPRHKKRLPLILNQNIKVGNALIGTVDLTGLSDLSGLDQTLTALRRLRQSLTRASVTAHQDTLAEIAGLSESLTQLLDREVASHLADPASHRPFHWPVEFPEVFVDESGQFKSSEVSEASELLKDGPGFDIIIGNPPWEIIKPDLREFYAQFDPDIESKLTRSQAEQRIAELTRYDPGREAAWTAQKAKIEAEATYFRRSPDYTRQGQGDTATHKLFLERGYRLLKPGGRLGFVIPSGIYTDLGTKDLREMLLNEGKIEYLYSFSNERSFFPSVHHDFKFTLLGAQKGVQSDGFWAAFRFNPRVAVAPEEMSDFLSNSVNLIYMRRESLQRFSPDSLSVMEFQSQYDANVAGKIYDEWPLIGEEGLEQRWNIRLNREFDMTNDRSLFNQQGIGYPLYEGKMIHQFNAFYSQPQFWISYENATQHFRTKKSSTGELDYHIPRLGFREITRATNERTLIVAILPPNTCCNHKISVASPRLSTYKSNEMLYCLGVLNSLVLDFVVRFKVTTGLTMFHFYQLPLPRLTAGNPYFEAMVARAAALTCTGPEFAGLWEEVMGKDEGGGMKDENNSLHPSSPAPVRGVILPPSGAARQTLRAELDALAAHLYGLSREEFAHILGTFPLVFPPTAEGQAKKASLLAVFDRFAAEVESWPRR